MFIISMDKQREWTRFIGQFQATNYVSGNIFRSDKAHVPDLIMNLLIEGIRAHSEAVTSKSTAETQYYKMEVPIEFAFRVNIKRLANKKDGATNYEYIPIPLLEMGQTDTIAHLTNLLEAPSPTNKAPKKAPTKKAATKKPAKKAAGKKKPKK